MMEFTGFKIIKIDIRKLTREDLPYVPFISKIYRYIPDAWLDMLSKRWGWYISVLAAKS